jgi:hypothetical protein
MWAMKFLPDYRHLLLFKNILEAQYVLKFKKCLWLVVKLFVCKFNCFCSQSQQDGYLWPCTLIWGDYCLYHFELNVVKLVLVAVDVGLGCPCHNCY